MDYDPVEICIKKKTLNPVFNPIFPAIPGIRGTGTNANEPLQIIYGGAGSGKSVSLARRCVLDLLREDRNYLITRNTARTLGHTVFAEVRDAIDHYQQGYAFDVNKSDKVITCIDTQRQALFVGLDDTQKLKSIRPLKGVITDIWEEEATEDSESAHDDLEIRMRGRTSVRKRHTLSFNPISRLHWIARRYFNGLTPPLGEVTHIGRATILRTCYKHNRFLDEEDGERLERYKTTDPWRYMVYALGEWGVLGQAIFSRWRVEDLSDRKFDVPFYGLDFGYSNDPTALVGSVRKGDRLYVPVAVFLRGLTNPQIADAIRPIVGKKAVYCDSSEPKSIAELQHCGINAFPVSKGKDSVLHGIQWLQQYEIIIDEKNQELINEFSVYTWKQDKDGNYINVPVDRHNHGIDALRYEWETEMDKSGIPFLYTMKDKKREKVDEEVVEL